MLNHRNAMQDGQIKYDEFTAMMKKGNQEAAANPNKRRSGVFTTQLAT